VVLADKSRENHEDFQIKETGWPMNRFMENQLLVQGQAFFGFTNSLPEERVV
jgi:hypothetical protein